MATEKNFQGTTPAAPAGNINAIWQVTSSPSSTDPISGQPVYDASCYVPIGGGLSVVEYVIPLGAGVVGTNVGPVLPSPKIGAVSSVIFVTKASDASVPFQFDIKKNGTSIFTGTLPTVAAGTAANTVSTFTNLTAVPLAIAQNDLFTLNIIQGSAAWVGTIQART
jgi:hypothetical protein